MKNWFAIVVFYLLVLNRFCLIAQNNSIVNEIDAVNNLTFEEKLPIQLSQ